MKWLVPLLFLGLAGCRPETETVYIETIYECWVIPVGDAAVGSDEDGGSERD